MQSYFGQIMSESRRFGKEISGNRGKRCETSIEARAAMIDAAIRGEKKTVIAKEFKVDRSTVYDAINRWKNHKTMHSRPRKGRPKVLSKRAELYIVQLVRRNPRRAYAALADDLDGAASYSTIRRVLRRHRLRKWHSAKRIMLTEDTAAERYEYTRAWRGHEAILVGGYQSDECTVQNDSNTLANGLLG